MSSLTGYAFFMEPEELNKSLRSFYFKSFGGDKHTERYIEIYRGIGKNIL